ncbi:MAG: hypothetical protein HYY13_00215 [Nitrospirae bacterium]|nr:hypothetical protein [Nitrospirota bacterium]
MSAGESLPKEVARRVEALAAEGLEVPAERWVAVDAIANAVLSALEKNLKGFDPASIRRDQVLMIPAASGEEG